MASRISWSTDDTTVGAVATGPFFRHVRRGPTGLLRDVVRESWLVQAERCRMAVEAALPDAAIELYFNLGSAGRHIFGGEPARSLAPRAAWVVGPHDRPMFVEKETRDCDVVGVRLRPGPAARVLGVPASELTGSLLGLELFWGATVDEVRDRLHATADPRARLEIVEQAVATRVSSHDARWDDPVSRALRHAVASASRASVGEIAAAHGLTHRRMIAMFVESVGLKPKVFHRVQRLRRVFRLVHARPRPSWAAIAHACGYFDQAHLINDFRSLTGITPSEYEATRSSVGRGFVPHRLA